MNTGPLVSIITIVFNGEKHLQQTINSVASQTYSKIEYIIVDGGSTDNTLNIIRLNENHITKWISEKDRGISDAFNKGIGMCTGDIIGIVNSDDWLETDAIHNVVSNINDSDIVYGEVQFWFKDKMQNATKSNHKNLRLGMTLAHPACFVRRELYDMYGGFDENYKVAMDYDLMLRFLHKGVKFSRISKVLTNMRTEGVSDRQWLNGILEEVNIKNKYYSRLANLFFFLRQYLIFNLKRLLRVFNK